MKKIRTVEAAAFIGKRVTFSGWLQQHRQHGSLNFIILRDGWGTIQAVCENEEALRPLADIGLESIIAIEGNVVAMPQAPNGFELHQPRFEVITAVHQSLPVTINKRKLKASLPTLLDHAVITNRHVDRQAIFRLASGILASFRQTLYQQHFTEIQTPKLVASATESGANVFELNYFGRAAYLAQSPQFYKQIMVGVFERVFEVGPVFRAEHHNTSRHINQYVSLDVEFGFIENHFTVMGVLEEVIKSIIKHLEQHYAQELARLEIKLPNRKNSFPQIHFAAAKKLMAETGKMDAKDALDLSPMEERWLGQWAMSEFGSDFLFVTGYPMAKRPFYTHPDPENPIYSYSFDLLFRGLELVTGGQRLNQYNDYLTALNQANLPVEPFTAYLEAFQFGMPPHGGFAIGLERFLNQLLNLINIRLGTLFPRDMQRLTP